MFRLVGKAVSVLFDVACQIASEASKGGCNIKMQLMPEPKSEASGKSEQGANRRCLQPGAFLSSSASPPPLSLLSYFSF